MPSHVLNAGVIGRLATSNFAVGVADASTTLEAGRRYSIVSTIDCFVRIGAAATVAAGTPLLARLPADLYMPPDETDLHAITAAGAGTLYCSPVEGC